MTQATNPYVYIPDFADQAVSDLPSQFRGEGKTVNEALMRALGDGVQLLEDSQFGLAVGSRIDVAAGAMLDVWGDLVGEDRGGLADIDYRRFIKARILVNRASGSADDFAEIMAIITAPSTVRVEAYYPAELILYAFRESAMSDAVVARVAAMLTDCKPIGIKLQAIEAIGSYLGFSENPGAPLPMPLGTMARNIL